MKDNVKGKNLIKIFIAIITATTAITVAIINNYDRLTRQGEKNNAPTRTEEKQPIKKSISTKSDKVIMAPVRKYDPTRLRDLLRRADNYFDVGHFYEAAKGYEEASRIVPSDRIGDISLLDKARDLCNDSKTEDACIIYRKYFTTIR
jgi:hypothetical protein